MQLKKLVAAMITLQYGPDVANDVEQQDPMNLVEKLSLEQLVSLATALRILGHAGLFSAYERTEGLYAVLAQYPMSNLVNSLLQGHLSNLSRELLLKYVPADDAQKTRKAIEDCLQVKEPSIERLVLAYKEVQDDRVQFGLISRLSQSTGIDMNTVQNIFAWWSTDTLEPMIAAYMEPKTPLIRDIIFELFAEHEHLKVFFRAVNTDDFSEFVQLAEKDEKLQEVLADIFGSDVGEIERLFTKVVRSELFSFERFQKTDSPYDDIAFKAILAWRDSNHRKLSS